MQKITPFLMFEKGAAEALEFYASVFENARLISTMPGPDGRPMGGTLEIDGQQIMAFDGGQGFSFSEGVSLFVNAETQDEIDRLTERLTEGGEQQPCGWVRDRFGVSWQIVPPILGELLGDRDREKANRVVQAMLGMKKLSIQELKKAARA